MSTVLQEGGTVKTEITKEGAILYNDKPISLKTNKGRNAPTNPLLQTTTLNLLWWPHATTAVRQMQLFEMRLRTSLGKIEFVSHCSSSCKVLGH